MVFSRGHPGRPLRANVERHTLPTRPFSDFEGRYRGPKTAPSRPYFVHRRTVRLLTAATRVTGRKPRTLGRLAQVQTPGPAVASNAAGVGTLPSRAGLHRGKLQLVEPKPHRGRRHCRVRGVAGAFEPQPAAAAAVPGREPPGALDPDGLAHRLSGGGRVRASRAARERDAGT